MKTIQYLAVLAAVVSFGATAHAQSLQLDSTTDTSVEVKTQTTEGKKDADSSLWIRVQQELNELDIEITDDSATTDKEHKGEIDIQSTSVVETNVEVSDDGNIYRPVIQGRVPVEATGVYLKLGDIKGESLDNGGGDENATDALSANETIEVKGVEVRGWDPTTKKEVTDTAPKDTASVKTEADLALFAAATASEDTLMESVSFNYGKIEWEYKSQGRLFGFIPVTFTSYVETDLVGEAGEEIRTDEYKRVKVRYPWYRFLMRPSVPRVELENELNAVVEAEVEAETQVSPSQTKVIVLAKAFQSVSNILKAKHDAEMATIQNTR